MKYPEPSSDIEKDEMVGQTKINLSGDVDAFFENIYSWS
jgi:hypothetical protein